ncbi:ankyrin repeat-containing domain protein, partial [Blastocladiella britannica]
GRTRLFKSAKRGDLRSVRELVSAGANVNHKDNAGWSPLHEAVVGKHAAVVRLLLEHGANPNAQGYEGNTALHDADTDDYLECAALLLRYGASVSTAITSRIPTSSPPLDLTKVLSLSHDLIVELVACRCVDVNVSDNAGWTPLHELVSQQRTSLVTLLLRYGADVNARGHGGISPLHLAAQLGNQDLATLLLDHGAD